MKVRGDYIFRGEVIHFSAKAGGLHVDWFDYNDLKYQYFLSHAHTDHYSFDDNSNKFSLMSAEFISELKKNKRVKIYCTAVTRDIILRRHNNEALNFEELRNHVEVLEAGEKKTINLIGKNGKESGELIRVTAIPANHIPGAVMFLFEDLDVDKRALYTGDFRYDVREENEEMRRLKKFVESCDKVIDHLYVDITCLDIGKLYHPDQNELPTRQESKDLVIELIDSQQPKKIHVDASMIGSEDMVIAVAESSNNTAESILSRLDPDCQKKYLYEYMLEKIIIPPATTSSRSELHISPKMISFDGKCKKCDKKSTLRIRASLKWIFKDKLYSSSNRETWTNKENNYWRVLYSHHSSDAELREFLSHLRYKKVYPINKPFSRYLEEKGSKISKTFEERHNYMRESLYCTLDKNGWKPRVLWFLDISKELKSDDRFEVLPKKFENYLDIMTKIEELTLSSFFYYVVIPCSTGANWDARSIHNFIYDLAGMLTGNTAVLLFSRKSYNRYKWKQEIEQIQPSVKVNLHYMDLWNIPEFVESNNPSDMEQRIVLETLANLRRNRDRKVLTSDWPIPYEFSEGKRNFDRESFSEPQSQEIEMTEIDGGEKDLHAHETEPQSQEIEMNAPGE